jgi:hypothetical protein
MEGTTLSVTDTAGPLDVSRVFVSSGVPDRALESRGWPRLSRWMKAQIRAKTRNPGRGWTELCRPDEKKGHPGASSGRQLEML